MKYSSAVFLTSTLLASTALSWGDDTPIESLVLSADDVKYNTKAQTVTATGKVEVLAKDGSVWADELIYNAKTEKIIAKGNVVYVNDMGVASFLDKLELSGNLETGVIDVIKMRLGEGGPAMIAESAEKMDDGKIALNNVVYSPCEKCSTTGRRPWSIRAERVTYHQNERKLSYKNAYLDAYDFPVIYLPYFKHPIGDQVGQSGALPPRFGNSTSRGFETTLGYYLHRSENEDYTFRTRLMTERGAMAMAERRHIGMNTESEIRGGIIADEKTGSTRSYLQGEGEYVFSQGKRIGINTDITSDDTFYDEYFAENPTYLTSTAYAENADKNTYAAIWGTRFQDLREDKDAANTAQLLPSATFEKVLELDDDGTQLTFTTDAFAIARDEGDESRRVVAQAAYKKPIKSPSGHLWELGASARGDIYHIDNTSSNEREGFTGRALAQTYAKWEKPFISPGGNHTITPKAMAVLAPRGGNPESTPNEDSTDYELDISNLFSTNRYAGLDRVETGPRFVYGLDNYWGGPNTARYWFFVGQSWRMFNEEELPDNGGTATKFSDWVGQASAEPTSWLGFSNRFRLDNADFEARRMDTDLRIGHTNKNFVKATYSFLDGGPEEVKLQGQWKVNSDWALEAQSRRDLSDEGKQLLTEGIVSYTHNCYKLSFTARRRGFDNQDVQPSTDFMFNIELLSLGRDDENPFERNN